MNEPNQPIAHIHQQTVVAEALDKLLFSDVRGFAWRRRELDVVSLDTDKRLKKIIQIVVFDRPNAGAAPRLGRLLVNDVGEM